MAEMRKVLVVDDDEIVRLSHMRTLAGQSCDLEAVRGGAQALESMQKKPADVVLLDLRMPEMDGLSALKSIKEKWPQTEVVVITGYPSVYTAREAAKLGAFDYLAKPVSPDTLVAVANAAMAERVSAAPTGQEQRIKDVGKGWAKYLSE
jgi:DNA-binding NtrC family response regulator